MNNQKGKIVVIIICLFTIGVIALSCKKQVPQKDVFLFERLQINESDIEKYEIIYQKEPVWVSVGILENKPYFSELTDFLNCKTSFWDIKEEEKP